MECKQVSRESLFGMNSSQPKYISRATKTLKLYGIDVDDEGLPELLSRYAKKLTGDICKVYAQYTVDSLDVLARTLAEFFIIRYAVTIVTHDDTEVTCNWSVSQGPFTEWLKEQLSNCMAKSHTVEVQIDKNQERMAFIQLNAERLGWYLLPEFIDIAGFLPVFLEMPEQVEYQVMRRKRHGKVPDIHQHDLGIFEEDALISGLKEKLLFWSGNLSDPQDEYTSLFNRVIDRSILGNRHQPAMYRKSSIIQSFLDEFSASVLTLPVRFNDDTLIALWTPWAEPFSQFSRLRPVEEDMVYTPTPGQVRWKNEDVRRKVTFSLISRLIASDDLACSGILHGWKNHYLNRESNIRLAALWAELFTNKTD